MIVATGIDHLGNFLWKSECSLSLLDQLRGAMLARFHIHNHNHNHNHTHTTYHHPLHLYRNPTSSSEPVLISSSSLFDLKNNNRSLFGTTIPARRMETTATYEASLHKKKCIPCEGGIPALELSKVGS